MSEQELVSEIEEFVEQEVVPAVVGTAPPRCCHLLYSIIRLLSDCAAKLFQKRNKPKQT